MHHPSNTENVHLADRFARGLRYVALKLIRVYQLTLSPWVGNQCRFYPSCSHYAQQAITEHGIWRGSKLALARLSKCHPYHPGGVDLVPQDLSSQQQTRSTVRNS